MSVVSRFFLRKIALSLRVAISVRHVSILDVGHLQAVHAQNRIQ